MIPAFDIEGGLPLALSRAVSVSGLVAAAGSLVLYAWAVGAGGIGRRNAGHAASSLRLVSGRFTGRGSAVAGCGNPRHGPATCNPMRYGRCWGPCSGACSWRDWRYWRSRPPPSPRRLAGLAAGLGCAALVLQAGHSHALAMGGSPALLASSTLHILAAGLWLGGLPALLAVVWPRDQRLSRRTAAERFSWLGIACMAALLATASFQAWVLVASLPGLVGTAYGWMVGVKAALFAGLLGLAARNRRRLTPALPAPDARRALGLGDRGWSWLWAWRSSPRRGC